MTASKKQTTLQGIFNVLLTAVGVGMLSLSQSMAAAGWLIGFPLLIGFGLLAIYLCILLERSMTLAAKLSFKNNSDVVTYEDVGFAAFGVRGRLAVTVPLHLALVGCSCALVYLLADCTSELIELSTGKKSPWTSVGRLAWIWGLPLMLLIWLPTMRHVGYVSSSLGLCGVLSLIVCVVVGGFKQYATFSASYNVAPKDATKLGFVFAALTFAFAVTCTVPTIIRDLEDRKSAPKVLFWGLILTITVYLVIALAGYLGWGVALNTAIYKAIPVNTWVGYACRVSLIIACACHYAVMLHPTCRELEDLAGVTHMPIKRTLLRSTLAIFTFLVASVVQKLDVYVGLLGSVTFAAIHSILPPILYMRLSSLNDIVIGNGVKTCLYAVVALSLVGGTFGVIESVQALGI